MENSQLNVKFLANRRGDQNLALHGYIYRVNRRGPDKVFWRCTIPECSAAVSTENTIPVGLGREQHNHPADHTEIVAKQIMNLVTERCAKEVKPIPSIHSEELNKLRDKEWDDTSRGVVERLPTFNSAKSSLYRSRRKQTPPLPRSMTDTALEGKWTQTATGGSFLLFDDNQPTRRSIAFVTTENLRDLANADIFFCDGTFYTCQNLFYQIYSIHIPIDDVMIPVIYVFLAGKSQAPYTRFFTLIKDKIADLGLVFAPTSAMADFETAVHNSIREIFPDIYAK